MAVFRRVLRGKAWEWMVDMKKRNLAGRWQAAVSGVLLPALLAAGMIGCGSRQEGAQPTNTPTAEAQDTVTPEVTPEVTTQPTPTGEDIMVENYDKMILDVATTYQTMESFGTSGAWWSQYVGGFTKEPYGNGVATRDAIAELLFDKEKGIGLTSYRYNLGAGSVESRTGTFWDNHRKAQCFETEPGVYDFTKDENAVWFLKKAVELGVQEVVFFCNSPLVRLTDNGLPHMSEGGSKTNIQPENYDDFANYCYDVIEHFIAEGVPVKFLSPINEPQWDWYNAQEGCHYSAKEVRALYLAFLDELEKRPQLLEVLHLSGPESGEWGGQATDYTQAILGNERLAAHFDGIDNHSYWSNNIAKESFRNWMIIHYPDVKLRTSEWCEMVNGSDVTMDSAYHLAQQIAEDLTILNVVSWQNWVGVAPGGYRDGLIYIDEASQKFRALKRLWSFGNYSRYIRPGYVRVELTATRRAQEDMMPTAFIGTNEDTGAKELVMVFINEDVLDVTFLLDHAQEYHKIAVYETSDAHDLECVKEGEWSPDQPITIAKMSVTTVVLTK